MQILAAESRRENVGVLPDGSPLFKPIAHVRLWLDDTRKQADGSPDPAWVIEYVADLTPIGAQSQAQRVAVIRAAARQAAIDTLAARTQDVQPIAGIIVGPLP